MPKTLTVKITQTASDGIYVPSLLPSGTGSLAANCYTHTEKSAFTGLNSSNVVTWSSASATRSSGTITYVFNNITSGKYVSFILDFSGADMNEINSYLMEKRYLYGDNAKGNLDTQTPQKTIVNKTSFKRDSSSQYYILATTEFGPDILQSQYELDPREMLPIDQVFGAVVPGTMVPSQTMVSPYRIYYKRTIRQRVDFSITSTVQYNIIVAEQDENVLPRIAKVYYKTSQSGTYQLLTESGVNSHTVETDYVTSPMLIFKFEMDNSVPNLSLYKGYYTVAVGTGQVQSLTGEFTSDKEITIQNIQIGGLTRNIFTYASENNTTITMSVTTLRTVKTVPVVLVLYHTKDDFSEDGVDNFSYKTASGTVLMQPTGTEITDGHSFTNSDGQTCIFKILDTSALKAEQDSLNNYFFKMTPKIVSTNVSEQYQNVDMSVWFCTGTSSQVNTSTYMANENNWYKSVWLSGYQNGALNTCGYISGDLQGNAFTPTTENPNPTVFTQTSSQTSGDFDFNNVTFWRINLRFTPKSEENQQFKAYIHQMFIRRSFTTSYRTKFYQTRDDADGCIGTTKHSVFMVEIEARNADGTPVTGNVNVKINGGSSNGVIDEYYQYSDEQKKYNSYRLFFRNFLRTTTTTRLDWWDFKANPISSSMAQSYKSYIENENTTHIACIECFSYQYENELRDYTSCVFPRTGPDPYL